MTTTTRISRRRLAALAAAAAAVAAVVLWFVLNPGDRFGLCRFGLTTYDHVPHPVSDLQVRADGEVRRVPKTHDLRWADVAWVFEANPDVVIIATGWDGRVTPADAIRTQAGCDVLIHPTAEAVALYNRLRAAGKRVAIHVHATC